MVDGVIEIPLPGRTFCGTPRDDRAMPPRVTTSAYIAGPENRVAAGTLNRLLTAPDSLGTLNVLAIYGTTGTGKTHLTRGLVQAWQVRDGVDSALYLPASDFRYGFIDALQREAVSEYRRRLRSCHLLAIDDVDHLPRDASIQQELRNTIDELRAAGATIVVTLSTPASAARNLSVDVRSRLAEGLELRLAPPDEAARAEIARHVSAALDRPLSIDASRRLAAEVSGTALDVFAALFEMNDFTDARTFDVASVERLLAHRAARRPSMRAILQVVARYYRVPQKLLKSSIRRQSVVTARAMAVYLAREIAGLSYERIGQAVGGRDHSTIMHNHRKIALALEHDVATRDALAELEELIRLHH